jgi:hypothetical protein
MGRTVAPDVPQMVLVRDTPVAKCPSPLKTTAVLKPIAHCADLLVA